MAVEGDADEEAQLPPKLWNQQEHLNKKRSQL